MDNPGFWLTRRPHLARLRSMVHLADTASLDGIERLPTLLNLHLGGVFRDLAPLAALPQESASERPAA